MSVIGSNILAGASSSQGYQISRSVRLRSSASAYFNRTFSASGTTHTQSFWVKRGSLGSNQTVFGYNAGGSTAYALGFLSSDAIEFYDYNSAYVARKITTQVFRDPSAWYHIVLVANTANATAADRVQIWVNGARVTSFSTSVDPTQNAVLTIANSQSYNYARLSGSASPNYFDGYLTEINFIDGQALTPSSFGETDAITGVWKPKKYAGTYGTNGFYLNFSDNTGATATTIGKDSSGNGNNYITTRSNNFSW